MEHSEIEKLERIIENIFQKHKDIGKWPYLIKDFYIFQKETDEIDKFQISIEEYDTRDMGISGLNQFEIAIIFKNNNVYKYRKYFELHKEFEYFFNTFMTNINYYAVEKPRDPDWIDKLEEKRDKKKRGKLKIYEEWSEDREYFNVSYQDKDNKMIDKQFPSAKEALEYIKNNPDKKYYFNAYYPPKIINT